MALEEKFNTTLNCSSDETYVAELSQTQRIASNKD